MANKKVKRSAEEESTPLGFIVNDLGSLDIESHYEFLKTKMKLGKDRLKLEILAEAIDDAPEFAFNAARLYAYAKEQLQRFEDTTFSLQYAEMAEQANEELEKKKKLGKISGQITKEKIENWILLNKEEYHDLLKQRRELKAAVEVFSSLSAQFESKKSLLQTQGRLIENRR